MDEKRVQCWGWSHAGDVFRGDFATREEAIKEGQGCMGSGVAFWIGGGNLHAPTDFAPDGTEIIELMGEAACNEVGDAAEEWPDVTDDARRRLTKLISDWAAEHCQPVRFWTLDRATKEWINPVAPGTRPAVEDSDQ